MSLKVWLPLNGTLENKGLSNVTITNNGATVDNDGKIGKCYYFDGSSDIRISLPSDMTTILGCTVVAWIKCTSSVVALGGISQNVSNYSLPCVTLYTSGWQFTSPIRKGYGYVTGGVLANTNVWHHVACSVDEDGNIQTYLDGNKVASNTLTALNVADNVTLTNDNFIEIGEDHPGADEQFTGYVNDFRIYDNALSPAEIRKLSQCLVMHLKLDSVFNGTQVTDSSGYGHHGTIVGTATIDNTSPRFNNAIHMTNTSSSNHIACELEIPTIQTVSLWVKSSKSNQVIFADRTSDIEFGIYSTFGTYETKSNQPLFDLSNYVANEWNHVVVTKNETTYRMFINGIESTTTSASKNYYLHTTSLWLLNRNANNSYAPDASISDFRVYATELSASDIKELYQTGAKIHKSGRMYSCEFVEQGSRELLAGNMLTDGYSNRTTPTTRYANGEIVLTDNCSVGSVYIPINPSGKTYLYDIEVTKDEGNYFLFGIERYDANKTPRSNNACVYQVANTNKCDHKRYFGIVDLSTDGVNPCAFISLRLLNDWSNHDNRTATVHKLSLREVTTLQEPKVKNNGDFVVDELIEYNKPSFYKNGIVESKEFIEM